MDKLIYKIAMNRSKSYLVNRYSTQWYSSFYQLSLKILNDIRIKIPDIGSSIFSLNYKFAPVYIAWYKAMEELKVPRDESVEIIWVMNERMIQILPDFLLRIVGKFYFRSFREKSKKHIQR